MKEEMATEPPIVEQGLQHSNSAWHVGRNFTPIAERQQYAAVGLIVLPWTKAYKTWRMLLVLCAILTVLFESYEVAFVPAGLQTSANTIFLYFLTGIFLVDIVVNFNLAFEEHDAIVDDRGKIAQRYLRGTFWLDAISVFPFYAIALAMSGDIGKDTQTAQLLALLRFFTFARLHRVSTAFEDLQYNMRLSLMWLTLLRNFVVAFLWTHLFACIMYFVSRQYNFNEDTTWIGGSIEGLSSHEIYTTALYWYGNPCIIIMSLTNRDAGYGDFSPVNVAEQIVGMIYMLLNIVLQAWIIGSITLLVVKNDENTGHYRDTLERLEQYAKINKFGKEFREDLTAQVILDYENHDVADEHVLSHFPTAVRRKVLSKLYHPYLRKTQLMQNVRQQFVDAFLATCSIEMFRPGEEILQRGNISLHLYLLVGGEVEVLQHGVSSTSPLSTSIIQAGEFLNEVGFFTDSPQIDTVRTLGVCKTLTISRNDYRSLADDHPGSAGKILKNLLQKVKLAVADLPDPLELLRAGSVFQGVAGHDEESTTMGSERLVQQQNQSALTSIQELVEMHISKQQDDHTTTFLFAASRGDIKTVSLMCDQGFDPNSSDYDKRTALMVSAMKGNTDVVAKLLGTYKADPNLADMHGSTALFEAAKNGHEDTMKILLAHNASLCMPEALAASTLCQVVFDGDVKILRRLLKSGIQVNAGDYDKRTAGHIAAAEGNISALSVLLDFGADLNLRDRWMHTATDEASTIVKEFLRQRNAKTG